MPILGTVASAISGNLTGPASYESIQTFTLGSNTQGVTFSSIPSTYKHLELRYISRDTYSNTSPGLQMLLNGGTWTSVISMTGSGSGAPTTGAAGGGGYAYMGNSIGDNLSAGLFATGILRFVDYANTNKVKTFTNLCGWQNQTTGSGQGQVTFYAGALNTSSAISSITIQEGDPNFKLMAGSIYALYGIKG